jgi:hypothetical protein
LAIDDPPLTVAQALLAAEDRSRTAGWVRAAVAGFCKLLPFPGKAIASFLEARDSEKLNYLMELVIQSLNLLEDKIETLASTSEEHVRFRNSEWLPLLEDAARRTVQVRAQERIARIALILTNSLVEDPPPQADDIEEMMRIAAELADRDVLALRIIVERLGPQVSRDKRMSYQGAYDRWKSLAWNAKDYSEQEIESIGLRLSGLGLLARLDRHPTHNAHSSQTNGYELLFKGVQFTRRCQRL